MDLHKIKVEGNLLLFFYKFYLYNLATCSHVKISKTFNLVIFPDNGECSVPFEVRYTK